MEKIGEKIKRARIKAGMTQRELAEKLGISYTTMSNMEKSYYKISITRLMNICEILDMKSEGVTIGVRTSK